MMKSVLKFFAILLLAVLPSSLVAQDATVVLNYMKVNPGMEEDYIQSEMAWKKIHEKRIEAGTMSGWQLWRNVFAAADDPYQYITIDWYNGFAQSLAGDPEGFWEETVAGLFTEEEGAKIWELTVNSHTLAHKEVMHRMMEATSDEGSRYILVNRMKVKPGNENAYLESENTYSKPLQEAKIKDGQMTHWSVWQAWPYSEGQIRFSTVDGYKNAEQMTANGADLLEKVHPGMTWDDWTEKVGKYRTQASIELWEIVDSVFPPAPAE
jgi:hypothetical protein